LDTNLRAVILAHGK